jgi:O-acetyl-ADP-ribose deacetylase
MGVGQLRIYRGSILDSPVEVIVNAANSTLLGGGGVDGKIHDAAGPGLLAECRTLGGCPTGEARLTGAHALPFRHIIHAVGPIWRGGSKGEAELLANCYRNALDLAQSAACASIGFPAISTGAFAFPIEPAARIAVAACRGWLGAGAGGRRLEIVLCAFDADVFIALRRSLERSRPGRA